MNVVINETLEQSQLTALNLNLTWHKLKNLTRVEQYANLTLGLRGGLGPRPPTTPRPATLSSAEAWTAAGPPYPLSRTARCWTSTRGKSSQRCHDSSRYRFFTLSHPLYRDEIYSLQILLSRTQAGPSRTVKQEQEQISPNHVQRINLISVHSHQLFRMQCRRFLDRNPRPTFANLLTYECCTVFVMWPIKLFRRLSWDIFRPWEVDHIRDVWLWLMTTRYF